MKNVVIVVGVQWGDEGKGKIVDWLSERAEFVARSQGGNNAGHTIVVGTEEFKFHLIPSGILYPSVRCFVTGGCVIDLESLIREMKALEARGFSLKGRLKLSAYAHLVMPYHKDWDQYQEELKGAASIGTTKKGIGPCYSDKANRIGIQLGELLDEELFKKHLQQVVQAKNQELRGVFKKAEIDPEELMKPYRQYADFLRPYISFDAEKELAEAASAGRPVLLEGAHGSYLDQTFGTYPYVTSSSTLAAGVVAGAGMGPAHVSHVVGVVKAFTTRVGQGPFPTEFKVSDGQGFLSNEEAREIATTTQRKRRMGWLDIPLIRQSIRWSGVTSLAITKLDVLDTVPEIQLCIAYKKKGQILEAPPPMTSDWEELEPVYEKMEGWLCSTKEVKQYQDLPKAAQAYLERIQKLCNTPASFISFGPEREKTLCLTELFR